MERRDTNHPLKSEKRAQRNRLTKKESDMRLERMLRLVAGALILFSLFSAYFFSYNWLFLTLGIGFNLFQSGFTNWCPMMSILKTLGIKERGEK